MTLVNRSAKVFQMRLVVDDIWTYIHPPANFGIIDSVTSYTIKGRYFSSKYRNRQWDGIKRFREFDRKAQLYRFPSGLTDRVIEALDVSGSQYEVEDLRCLEVPEAVYELPSGMSLRPYQREAHDALIARGRGVAKLPTAAGKTAIMASVIAAHNLPTLWLTDRKALLYQSHAYLEKNLKRKVGILGDATQDFQEITVAMVQTIVSRIDSIKDELQKFQVLVLDEAHHAGSNTWFESICQVPARFRYGCTATPAISGDGLRLLGVCGDILFEISPQDLIAQGYLTKPEIWFAKYNTDKIPAKAKWPTVYKQGITENAERNEKITEMAFALARESHPTITLANQINHGKLLQYLFGKAGISCEFIFSDTETNEREDILGKLQDRKLDNVIGITSILGEGVDTPRVEAVLNATGTKGAGTNNEEGAESTGRVVLQNLGRALRIAPGKTTAIYADLFDQHHKFLKQATQERLSALESEGYTEIGFWENRK